MNNEQFMAFMEIVASKLDENTFVDLLVKSVEDNLMSYDDADEFAERLAGVKFSSWYPRRCSTCGNRVEFKGHDKCNNCYEVEKRLPKYMRSVQGRDYVACLLDKTA